IGPKRRDAGEHAIADPGRRTLLLLAFAQEDAWRKPMLLRPGRGPGDKLAIDVALDDLDHRHRGQHAGTLELSPRARDEPVIGHIAQQCLQREPVIASDAEGARDLALAGWRGGALQELDDLLLGGKLA